MLQGFAVLERSLEVVDLNFEDHDILKTAGQQVAVVLAQAQAQEKLAETRQFEAMNKLSTFLMHDLKNLIAQQELVLSNAPKFKHSPEFVDDVIATVRSGAERMRRVLDQLHRSDRGVSTNRRVELSKLAMEVRSQCSDRRPVPEVRVAITPLWVSMDRDKLAGILTHLIRNAQDATPPDGRIDVAMNAEGDRLAISVADSGRGMDAEFVRERLFRPFDTTKGVRGMGIGAYQVRDTVRSIGGEVRVRSEPGEGTSFEISIPSVVIGPGGDQSTAPAA
jgi:putative PEP-CTERM system histidine kinase